MLEQFEHRGVWWLPEKPERRVPGVLTFSQDETRLELIGMLPRDGRPEEHFAFGAVHRPRILGLSTDGARLTLEQCLATRFQMSSGGLMTEQFSPSLILRGAHYEENEPVSLDELSVRYSQLDAWVQTSGLTTEFEADDGSEVRVAYSHPPTVSVALDAAQLDITFNFSFKDSTPVGTAVHLTQSARFALVFPRPVALHSALGYVYQLRNFLGLAVGRRVHPIAITGRVAPENGEPDARKLAVEVFYRLSPKPDEEQQALHPAQMLFTFPEARERFEALMQNWFAKQDLLRPVFDLYFGALYNRFAYVEQTFLSLMQAIETYHRRTSPATELRADLHQQRMKEILLSVPESYRKWLTGKLQHSNELVLRKRLYEVLGSCPTVVRRLIKRRKDFVQRLLTARNYLTHYDPSLEAAASKGLDLHPFVVRLRAIIEMCLLSELGFDCEEIDRLFERVGRYREADLAAVAVFPEE